MSSLRVLQIVPSLSLIYGGPSQMVLGLAKSLAAENIEVTILTTNANGDRGQTPLAVPIGQPVEQDGFQIYYFPCSPFQRYKFSLALLQWLAAHAHEYDLAHIHALFSPVSSAAAAVCRWKQLPYILRPLGTLDPADLQKKKWLKSIYAMAIERPNLASAAAVHFTSNQEAKISHRFGATTRDWVIPLGVELPALSGQTSSQARTELGLPLDQPIVLFMSRIDPKKGLDLLLPALEQLQAEGKLFHWVLAGSNPQDPQYEDQIRQQIQASPLADRTTITGFISGPQKAKLLQAADLFVLPSYYENFGIAVAEAMTVSLPVVISDQVHIWQSIEQAQAGWICTCDRVSLTDQLRSALQDSQERSRRGSQGRSYALKNYSWPAIAQQVISAYRSLIPSGADDKFDRSGAASHQVTIHSDQEITAKQIP